MPNVADETSVPPTDRPDPLPSTAPLHDPPVPLPDVPIHVSREELTALHAELEQQRASSEIELEKRERVIHHLIGELERSWVLAQVSEEHRDRVRRELEILATLNPSDPIPDSFCPKCRIREKLAGRASCGRAECLKA